MKYDPDIERRLAELRGIKTIQHGAETFRQFVARTAPQYRVVPPHLEPLYDLIDRSRFEPVRALVSMPPRHGKTTTLRLGLAYRTLYDPACQNFYCTFASDLSEEAGREVRNMARACGVRIGKVSVNESAKSGSGKVLDWKTAHGGGLKSTSVGGSITGRGANGGIIIIDDPIKGADVARSLNERQRVFRWIISDVFSRIEGGASVIIVQTRWHEDDPIGRFLLDAHGEDWQHINLPAISDGYGTPVDEKLTPEVAKPLWLGADAANPTFSGAMKWYAKARAKGEYEWWSLYQGVPRSPAAKIFGEEPGLFDLPLNWLGKRGMLMLDPAATAKTSSDYSALGAFSMDGFGDESRMHVARVRKMQLPIDEVAKIAVDWHKKYKLPVGIEVNAHGIAVPIFIRKLIPPKTDPRTGKLVDQVKIIEVVSIKDKLTRSLPAAKAWNAGRILVPRQVTDDGTEIKEADWVPDYVRVMQAFTGLGDVEDDVVDITAHAFNRMYKEHPYGSMRSVSSPGS